MTAFVHTADRRPVATNPTSEGAAPHEESTRAADTAGTTPKDARALTRTLLDRLAALEEGAHEYQYTRNTLIELNLPLVRYAASRFRGRTKEREDVVQVGTIGLIKAIDRFDLSREVEFATFALPSITGEIKRYFRDTSWAVHVPRRLQELRITLTRASEEIAQRLDRDPTPAELAEHLGMDIEQVIEGLVASNGYNACSLDVPSGDGEESGARTYADNLGVCDPALEGVEDIETLRPLIAQLDDRERRILNLRFGQEMSQSQIGKELGISQMHVSRLLSRILIRLRSGMLPEGP